MHQFSNAEEVYLWHASGAEDAPNPYYTLYSLSAIAAMETEEKNFLLHSAEPK